uniref:Uncharacterized protein n=1 Tax=Arundo donax TaxID=35708 RepID=A0A0A8Y7T2_ARUDO
MGKNPIQHNSTPTPTFYKNIRAKRTRTNNQNKA